MKRQGTRQRIMRCRNGSNPWRGTCGEIVPRRWITSNVTRNFTTATDVLQPENAVTHIDDYYFYIK